MTTSIGTEAAEMKEELQACQDALAFINNFYTAIMKNRRINPSEEFIMSIKKEEATLEDIISRLKILQGSSSGQ